MGEVVLFNSLLAGTVVCPGKSDHTLGHFFNNWNISTFRPYYGEITLKETL